MKVVALIPARFDSSRFHGKMLAKLGNKTVIRQTYERAFEFGIFDDVFVVTDNDSIYNEIVSNGGKALRSINKHETGTDRIAEVANNIDADIIINIQGDTPFVKANPLKKLINAFNESSVDVATLMQKIENNSDVINPNFVKIVRDLNDYVIYFSRSPIPYNRDGSSNVDYFEHIGVYAFRKNALIKFSGLKATHNELAEKIEAIRFLDYGMKIKVYETEYMGIQIDTEEDLKKANEFLINSEFRSFEEKL